MEKKITTTASVFGAALASMLVAPELQAEIVPLTFDPSTIVFSAKAYDSVHIFEPGGKDRHVDRL